MCNWEESGVAHGVDDVKFGEQADGTLNRDDNGRDVEL
jgi:hypothetical protein